ncbi:MAG: DUF6493 family protein [Flavobacteriaceae bacterium]|jgi:hypothetical protein|nr:DUF6493 family protein [Flavobacteriaceae bacterium]
MSKDSFYNQLEQLIASEEKEKTIVLLQNTSLDIRLKESKNIAKLGKYYSEYIPEEGNRNSYVSRGSREQLHCVQIAMLSCCNYKEIKSIWGLRKAVYEDVLSWYVPDWLGEQVNESVRKDWIAEPFRDIDMMYHLYQNNAFKTPLTDETWAYIMASLPYVDVYEKYPDLLEVQFWYLFQYETSVNGGQYELATETFYYWNDAIQLLVEKGKLDRNKVITAAIQAVMTFTNQTLCSWNMALVERLAITNKDLLEVQDDLLQLCNSSLSKVVNVSLDLLQKIIDEENFNMDNLLVNLPVIFNSTVKTTINKGVKLVSTLEKKYPQYNSQYAEALLSTFHIQDQTLQSKVAKLIVKLCPPTESLNEQLMAFQDLLLSETKNLLSSYIVTNNILVLDDTIQQEEDEIVLLTEITTVEDLIFFISSVWSSDQNYVFEQTVEAITRLYNQLTAEHIEQLLPSFDKAYKLLTNLWSATESQKILAFWFLEWSRLLRANNSISVMGLEKLHQKHLKGDKLYYNKTITYDTITLEPSNQLEYYYATLRPYFSVYYHTLKMLKEDYYYPVLCVPTHEPFYIDASELIRRLAIYQSNTYEVDAIDLQIAIARIDKDTFAEGLILANKVLKGELLRLMCFVMDSSQDPEGPFELYDVWRFVAMIKHPHEASKEFTDEKYTKERQLYCAGWLGKWEAIEESHTYKDYDYKAKKQVDKIHTNKIIKLQQLPFEVNTSLIFSRVNKGLTKKKVGDLTTSVNLAELIMYQIIDAKVSVSTTLLCFNPRSIDVILNAVIERCLHYGGSSNYEVAERNLLQGVLSYLLQMKGYTLSSNFYLFFGLALLAEDKVSRSYAAELWIKEVERLEQEKIGEVIGKVEVIEFVTIKRLTDSIQGFMMNVSVQHNKALQVLIEHIMVELNEVPIKGFKTLLEQYVEVLTVNEAKVTNNRVAELINAWSKVSATKKVTQTLLTFIK